MKFSDRLHIASNEKAEKLISAGAKFVYPNFMAKEIFNHFFS